MAAIIQVFSVESQVSFLPQPYLYFDGDGCIVLIIQFATNQKYLDIE
jgi:hypothetical protein